MLGHKRRHLPTETSFGRGGTMLGPQATALAAARVSSTGLSDLLVLQGDLGYCWLLGKLCEWIGHVRD